jgi:hypothetical protein
MGVFRGSDRNCPLRNCFRRIETSRGNSNPHTVLNPTRMQDLSLLFPSTLSKIGTSGQLFKTGRQSIVEIVVVKCFDQRLPSGSLDLTHKIQKRRTQF